MRIAGVITAGILVCGACGEPPVDGACGPWARAEEACETKHPEAYNLGVSCGRKSGTRECFAGCGVTFDSAYENAACNAGVTDGAAQAFTERYGAQSP